jgi:hypothetical protein
MFALRLLAGQVIGLLDRYALSYAGRDGRNYLY